MSTSGGSALFVYGTLLDSAVRSRLLARAVETVAARLPGYVCRRGRYYYIEPSADGGEIQGLLLVGLGDRDFDVLDRYEDVPNLYARKHARVIDGAGEPHECWLYVPTVKAVGG
jgi:gamma-glutamylcyclotransferase (GGCT)/AIG2-like uncharacterized protein YtfP